eukprot:TRINITY_DN36_c0_g1_i7.p1 TRINITY_DN36_c0_g1~~TRINITY_DN36_c0_g1_i7.p1  ORF type:complete len:151 (-),score=23.65 TRINITY_DN36_c0_g1_i7:68-520(-)
MFWRRCSLYCGSLFCAMYGRSRLKKCLDCVKQYCFDDLVKCAGVNSSVLPPKPYIPPQGDACNNAQDLLAFNKTYKTFHGLLEGCAKKNFGDADKTAKCLVPLTNNTLPCAECFGADAHCTVVHCSAQCMADPDSKNVWIVSSNIVSMTL